AACSRSTAADAKPQATPAPASAPASAPPAAQSTPPPAAAQLQPRAAKPVPPQLPEIVARINGETISGVELDRAVKALSSSTPLIVSPLIRATISGSCGGTGLAARGCSCAAAGGGVLCAAGGADAGAEAGAGVACGLASAAVLREQAASMMTKAIETARRT